MAKPIRIVAADPHQIVLDGMRYQFEQIRDMKLVGVAIEKNRLLEILRKENPDVLIMEIVLYIKGSGNRVHFTAFDIIRQARAIREDMNIILYTSYTNRFLLNLLADKAHPAAVFTKDLVPNVGEMLQKIKGLGFGVVMVGNDFLVVDRSLKNPLLSETETAVLTYLALLPGLSIDEIADTMGMALGTIKTHLARIYDKLGTTKRAEAVLIGLQRGILPPSLVLNIPDDTLGLFEKHST